MKLTPSETLSSHLEAGGCGVLSVEDWAETRLTWARRRQRMPVFRLWYPHGHSVGRRGARLVGVILAMVVIVLAQFLPDDRPFEVRLRQRLEGSPMSEDLVYTWTGYASDEAHAVVVAKREAAADRWAPEGPVAYRVVETDGFLPVAHEWIDRAS